LGTTTISAGDTTNIIGGQVLGDSIKLTTSNLNIESLQDTAVYDSQQKNISGQITVGAGWGSASGSASKSNIDANYASVNEQSGIIAGDKGYDVSVVNNTNLIGGIITSTQLAEDNGLNSFSTGTLTLSNIDNHSSYEGDSIGLSGSVGFSNPNATTKTDAIKSINTPPSTTSGTKVISTKSIGYGSDTDSQISTTYAGINTSNIAITGTSVIPAEAGIQTITMDNISDIHTDITTDTIKENSGSLVNTFDAGAVQKELDVQTRVTQEFNENATNAANALIAEKTKESRDNAIKAANSPDGLYKGKTAQEWTDEANSWSSERAAAVSILIAAATGSTDALETAIIRESLHLIASELRELMIDNSKKFAGVVDENGKVFNNMTGKSEGANGDNAKIGGTRWDIDLLCGADNRRCLKDENNNLIFDDQGRVQWNQTGADGMTLAKFLETPDGKKLSGATGGIQGMPGTLFGIPYDAGSWQDNLIEAYSGSHDFIGGYMSGLYDEQGNATRGLTGSERTIYNTWAAIAIPIATPFAMSELFDAQTWEIVNAALEMVQ